MRNPKMSNWKMIVYLSKAAWRSFRLNVPPFNELQRLLVLVTLLFVLVAFVVHVWMPLAITFVFTWPVFLQSKSRAYASLQTRNSTESQN